MGLKEKPRIFGPGLFLSISILVDGRELIGNRN
jgi:hypothetical protein